MRCATDAWRADWIATLIPYGVSSIPRKIRPVAPARTTSTTADDGSAASEQYASTETLGNPCLIAATAAPVDRPEASEASMTTSATSSAAKVADSSSTDA